MAVTPTLATLPQLLDRFRAASAKHNDDWLDPMILHTYHSTAIDGASLTLPQTQALIQTGSQVAGKPLTDHWIITDYHHALEQIMAMASQHEPLNLRALQEVAATLMHHTGGPIHSLLSSYDTRKGELRIDSALAGRRVLVAAHKLPAALTELLKGVNTHITQLKTPRQIYDLSFDAHFQLLTLHPFGAGNGLMARLLINYVQRYHKLPLSLVYVDGRTSYLAALESSWRQNTSVAIVSFLHSQLRRYLHERIDEPLN